MLKNNSVVKKLVATGEERIGKITQQLLGNEKFVATLQNVVGRTLSAKGFLDKSLRVTLSAMNLPSTADLELLRDKVEELEKLLTSVESKVTQVIEAKRT